MTDRDRRALIGGVAVLAVLLGYRYLAMPVIDSWSEARQRIAVASEAQASMQRQMSRLKSQRRQLESVYGEAVSRPLPDVDTARANFIKAVEDSLKANGLESQGVRSQPVRPIREVSGVSLVGLQVECTGQSRQLVRWLADLSASDPLMLVDSLRTSPDTRRPDRVQVSMVVATFARAQGETP